MNGVKIRRIMTMSVFSGVLYGFGVGTVVAVAMPYLEKTVSFSAAQLSSLVAAALFGSVVATPLSGPFADWIGRKRAIVLAGLAFAAGTPFVCLSGGTYGLLFAGLLLQGVAMSVVAVAVPLYLAEALPADMRGKGSTIFQLCIIGGILLSGLLGLVAAGLFGPADAAGTTLATKASAWKFLFAAEAVPAVALLAVGLSLDESPFWLKRGERKGTVADGTPLPAAAADSLWQRKYLVPFFLVVTILACTQGVGINSVLGYSVTMFQKAGLSGAFANWADFTFKVVMFVMTALACVLVDTRGRRFLMLVGTAGVLLGLVFATASFLALDHGFLQPSPVSGLVVAAGITIFVAAFAIGPGACTWILPTELLPGRIRATGMGVALLFDYLISTGFQATLLPIVERVGYGVLFGIFAGFGVIYLMAVWLFLPETKGKTLEEIELTWIRKN